MMSEAAAVASPSPSRICGVANIDPSSEAEAVGSDADGSSGGIGVVTLDVVVDVVVAPAFAGTGCDDDCGGIGIGCCC